MTKPAENLAAALLIAREESSKAAAPRVEALGEASEDGAEGEGAWIDEVTSQVAALWSGHREAVSFEAAMASAESPRRLRSR